MPSRKQHITTEQRVELACRLVARRGEYGLVTGLAREHQVSRQFLYDLRDRTLTAVHQELEPKPLGRPPLDTSLRVDRLAVQRAILVLGVVAHASVRVIGECLEPLLGVHRSIGGIHAVLKEAGQRARVLLPVPAGPVQAVADEVYAAQQPVLEVVEPESGLILALEPSMGRDETTWGLVWLELYERGVQVVSVIADGARGLGAGLRAAGGPQPWLDHWHTLRDLGRISTSLETQAYRKLEGAYRAQQAWQEWEYLKQHGRLSRPGRPLKAPRDRGSVDSLACGAQVAMERADNAATVLEWVREALYAVDAHTGQVRTALQVEQELKAAATLLKPLGGEATQAGKLIAARAAGLVAYLAALQAPLEVAASGLDAEQLRLVAWGWRHRATLDLRDASEVLPSKPEACRRVWAVLEGAVRSTGMVENLNSLLAPLRAAHKGLPKGVLALFAVYHNHHVFTRGKRRGHSPMALAGLPSPHWLDALGYGREVVAHSQQPPSHPAQTVNTLAA